MYEAGASLTDIKAFAHSSGVLHLLNRLRVGAVGLLFVTCYLKQVPIVLLSIATVMS
jgi:hypothetical protein